MHSNRPQWHPVRTASLEQPPHGLETAVAGCVPERLVQNLLRIGARAVQEGVGEGDVDEQGADHPRWLPV